MNKLSQIHELQLRDIFQSESKDFTPWLSAHLEQLSDKLGIEITDPEIEAIVGDFKLDILGVDPNSKDVIAIENQLEASDHTHLGQLITYASGVEAGIVVWVMPELRQEHQQALDWLNENSETSFFGVEVRAIQIGDSNPAIDFRVKVAPNDWQRGIRRTTSRGEISPRNELYRQFFAELGERYFKDLPGRRQPKAQPQSWYSFGGGKSGITFGWAYKMEDRFATELYIDVGDGDLNSKFLEELRSVTDIGDDLIGRIKWEELPGKRASRIAVYRDGDIESVSDDPSYKDNVIQWAIGMMERFESIFREHIKNLD